MNMNEGYVMINVPGRSIIRHPLYSSRTFENDIAVIRLPTPVQITSNVKLINSIINIGVLSEKQLI